MKKNSSISIEHQKYLKSLKINMLKVGFFRVAILIILLLLWETAADMKWIDPFLTSSPSKIVKTTLNIYNSGSLFKHIFITCYETVLGFTLGTIIGTICAVVLWSSPFLSKVLDPYLVVLNALPKVALAPIIIFWVGNGIGAIITIALLISIIVTIISVTSGFNEVDKGKQLLLKTFGATKFQLLRYLIIPASVPTFISALKINVGLSWVGVIMGEFLVAKEGLGFLIVYGSQISQLDMVMMSIMILAVFAYLMYKIVWVLERLIYTNYE